MEKIWQKMKQNPVLSLLCCALLVALAGLLFWLFKANFLILLVLLLCPLMHFFMMKDHKHDNSDQHEEK